MANNTEMANNTSAKTSMHAKRRYESVGKFKNFIRERGLQYSGCQETIAALGWETFVKEPPPLASTSLVLEFYANLPNSTDGTVYCRDQRVPMNAKAINAYYQLPDVENWEYKEFMKNIDYEAVIQRIAKPGTKWTFSVNNVRTFPGNCLTVEARVWYYFILARLMPGTHYSTVEKYRAVLIYAILQRMSMNVGQIIMTCMTYLAQPVRSNYPFTHMITQMCSKAGVIIAVDEPTIGLEPIINEAYLRRYYVKNKSDAGSSSVAVLDPSSVGPSAPVATSDPAASIPPANLTFKEQLWMILKEMVEVCQTQGNIAREMAEMRQTEIIANLTDIKANQRTNFDMQHAICTSLGIPVDNFSWQDTAEFGDFSDLFGSDFGDI